MSAGHPALYDLLVVLHVATAVVGFGAVALSGPYGALARRPDRPGGLDEVRRYFAGRGWASLLILAVPFLGAGALAVRPGAGAGRFGGLWVELGFGLWVVAAALLLVVIRPAEDRIRQALGEPPRSASQDRIDALDGPRHRELASAGRQVLLASAFSDLLFALALFIMVTQPA